MYTHIDIYSFINIPRHVCHPAGRTPPSATVTMETAGVQEWPEALTSPSLSHPHPLWWQRKLLASVGHRCRGHRRHPRPDAIHILAGFLIAAQDPGGGAAFSTGTGPPSHQRGYCHPLLCCRSAHQRTMEKVIKTASSWNFVDWLSSVCTHPILMYYLPTTSSHFYDCIFCSVDMTLGP